MPGFKVEVPHPLGQDEAASRVKTLLEHLRGRFEGQIKDMQQTWTDDDVMQFSFKTAGLVIKGEMDVQPDSVLVHGDLPFAAMLFKGRIESSIKEELEKCLSHPA
ncbi:Putative polyhydroxyalkanoic acid system protein (PHA_gran_rgn) [Bremerella volcania]|uniref:Polyhydroxyalkanoic acid system protein (PHA_gran_rgn) n=1 Tax=Bremerella volcania TaxID=2527984 RepID=A0A518C7E5_9BACT|nr:polyhydroxyalkanoic acid system family protein [Bremerella volcania]QDU75134.1 Putative polyhydroxyalkanoic acid system protein (PHA_gran_rgn) [Bremerella volcania]